MFLSSFALTQPDLIAFFAMAQVWGRPFNEELYAFESDINDSNSQTQVQATLSLYEKEAPQSSRTGFAATQ